MMTLSVFIVGYIVAVAGRESRSNLPLTGAVALTFALQVALVYTPFLQKFFQTVPLSARDLVVCFVLSSVVFWAVELEKLCIRWKTRAKAVATEPSRQDR